MVEPVKPSVVEGNRFAVVAREAWAKLPVGTHENFHGYRVVKLPKYVILMPTLAEWPSNVGESHSHLPSLRVVVFPKPRHIELFAKAGIATTTVGGPAFFARGGVGSASFSVSQRDVHYLELEYAQAHHRSGVPLESLSRSLVSAYAGWRVRALEEVAKVAKLRGLEIHFRRNVALLPRNPGKSEVPHLVKDLAEASRRVGGDITSNGKGLVMRFE